MQMYSTTFLKLETIKIRMCIRPLFRVPVAKDVLVPRVGIGTAEVAVHKLFQYVCNIYGLKRPFVGTDGKECCLFQ